MEIGPNNAPETCVKFELPNNVETSLFDGGQGNEPVIGPIEVDWDPLNEINLYAYNSGTNENSPTSTESDDSNPNSNKNVKSKIKKKITTIKNETDLFKFDEKDDSKILEHFGLDCEDCSHSSKTYLNFLHHSRIVHKKRAYVYCCNRQFYKRCRLLEHISWHTDPESFK